MQTQYKPSLQEASHVLQQQDCAGNRGDIQSDAGFSQPYFVRLLYNMN